MSESPEREEQLFAEAQALPAGERPRFLDDACRGDPAMRERLEELLRAHDSAGGFLEAPPADSGDHPPPGAVAAALESALGAVGYETPGTRIGRYKLLQKLGEGGCGVVWMAEQEEPVRRRVALKIIKLGMDTKEVIARFEAERQALAMMDHPNIAKVLDAGATDAGRPYFVMELVRGLKITDYCDQHNLSTSSRLELFSQVCHAVQHAHQKGVIHRDLKPSNILVTLHDGVAVPKVIDFGIAKATQGRLTDLTLFTAFEQFIGTPAYMSPEQAEMSGIDIDTRSDVYSLGVLLYELLTGRPPFDPGSLVQAGLDEIRRIIREVEPPRPSTNLSTLADADRLTVARLRGTDPARLSLLLRGDLDWIVMRCLEKDRTRRYETANGLAADILRHLRNEPVAARPPSNVYRLRKLIRRNRLAFAATGAVALAMTMGLAVSTWQAVRATRAEHQAGLERQKALDERARAEDLLTYMLGDLHAQLAKVGRLDVLESAGNKAMAYFTSINPLDLTDTALARQAKALTQYGEIRIDQARYPEAATSFAQAYSRAAALAARHPQDGDMLFVRGQAEYWIGFVHWKRGEFADAGSWLGRYHETCRTLVALDPARADWQSELAYGQHNLAVLGQERGEFAAARTGFIAEIATLEKLSAASPDDLELRFRISLAHSWLGSVAEQQGEFAEALGQHDQQRLLVEQLVLAEPRTARWRLALANALVYQSDLKVVTGEPAAAREPLKEARRLLDDLVAHDPTNRDWQGQALIAHLRDVRLSRRLDGAAPAYRRLDEIRAQFEGFTETETSDRTFLLCLTIAWRLEAQLRAAVRRTDALDATARSVEFGGRLVSEGRATNADIGEAARAEAVAGEIAAQAGEMESARRHWQRVAELLSPHLKETRDWRLLEPAARAAASLGQTREAQSIIARLNSLGFVPLDPWPSADLPDAAKNSNPPTKSK
jgi:serine/threonine protein kinase/tetratricopeptide (TPR) repeat protein